MTAEYVIVLLAGAASGGFINGLAGFGTSLFALGWWLQIMPPGQAVAIALVMSVVSGVPGAMAVRQAIEPRRLARFLLPALAGIPIGLALLSRIEAGMLKLMIGGFMFIYGGLFLWRREMPTITGRTPVMDGVVGFGGGVLGAMAGLSGALPTIWVSLRDWTKDKSRAVLQPFNLGVLGLSAALLALRGGYDRNTLIAIAVALPATMTAAWVGLRVFRALGDALFRRLLVIMTFAAGLAILVRELALA